MTLPDFNISQSTTNVTQYDTFVAENTYTYISNATIINGSQWITVTGYAPTQFSLLSGGTANATAGSTITSNLLFLTSPNQTAATSMTDPRLLTIPANSIVKSVILSNRGGSSGTTATTIAPSSTTFSVSMFPVAASNLPATPVALAAGHGLLLPSQLVADINNGQYASFNAAVRNVGAAVTGLALTEAGIGAEAAGFLATDAVVGVYCTTASTNTTGALKIQITYHTITL